MISILGEWEMEFTLGELAELAEGTLDGDSAMVVHGAKSLYAAGPGEIAFLDHARRVKVLEESLAGAFLVPADTPPIGRPSIRVADPFPAFIRIAQKYQPEPPPRFSGVDSRAAVDDTAKLGPGVVVHPFAVIGYMAEIGAGTEIRAGAVIGSRCRIGAQCVIHPHAVLYDNCVLKDRVVVHAGAILGADGFGYKTGQAGHAKVPQLGNVEIAEDCELGACTTIDRGTFGPTQIGLGTKIDNLVQVGHNCRIGKHNLLVSQTGIAGSCRTGDFVVIAGQVGLADHVNLAEGTVVGAKSGVMRDSKPGEHLLGVPARPERDEKRILISLEKIPELVREVKRLSMFHPKAPETGETGE